LQVLLCGACRLLPDAHDANAIPDLKLRAMLQFALSCARSPQSLGPEDYAALRKFDLSNKEIVEIISMSAVAVYANILADATGMEEDPMFEAY